MATLAVFDCMVFLQGAAKAEGPAGACLKLVEEGAITLCLSQEVLDEVREVLLRPKMGRKFPSLTVDRVEAFLGALRTTGNWFDAVPAVAAALRDPDDAPYLNLAICAAAKYLVTRDNDLLELMRDATFIASFPHLTIIEPVAFLNLLAAELTDGGAE
ncbi:MAG: putative toxin-antitoxin system toxin component, PIN family [Pirellulaceae bacterium]|nr:putative toxin-antitoxin system toxin component, PIN family [Pirellulaceae bacterium]